MANLAQFLIMTAQQPGLPVSRSFMKMLHIIGSNRLRLQCGMPLFNEDFDESLAIVVPIKLVIIFKKM